MKNYVAPHLEVINERVEGIYAISGNPSDPDPEPMPPPTPDGWGIHCEYRNHNSGSHSEVAIIAMNNGSKSGDCLTMHFSISDFRLDCIKDSSGYTVSNVSETGFTIIRNGHFNPGERIEFNLQIIAKDSQYHGSVGKTGEYMPCKIECTGYSVG